MSINNEKLLKPLHTKCYDVILPALNQNGMPQVEAAVLIATQSPLTRKWRLSQLRYPTQDGQKRNAHFNSSAAQEMSSLEVMEALAAFEAEHEAEGHTSRPHFKYQNAYYFRDVAASESIIFDQETGHVTYLEQGVIPARDGVYDPQDIEDAAAAYGDNEKAAAMQSGTILDRMFKPYHGQELFHIQVLFQNLNTLQAIQGFTNNLHESLKSLKAAITEKSFREIVGHWDSTTTIKHDKNAKKHLTNARKYLDQLNGRIASDDIAHFTDLCDATALYFDILSLQLDAHDMRQNGKTPDETKFRAALDKLYADHNISDGHACYVARATFDIEEMKIPDALISDLQSLLQWCEDAEQQETFQREEAVQGHKSAAPIAQIMSKFTNRTP